MTEIKKGDDAGDHAPKPKADKPASGEPAARSRQDAPNYDRLKDGGRSVPVEDMNSANDE